MNEEENSRTHHFEFPGQTGKISIALENNSFPDVEDDELYKIGKLTRDFLYGLLIENKDIRNNYINIFQSILKDISISIDDKDINDLFRFSDNAFHNGDYKNSLFISKFILSQINQIIDRKIANNDNKIEKEIIHLQISTLNFIGYLFSKLGKNIDYGLKLTIIANKLLDQFDESDEETISLRSAILDTLGVLYILKNDWDKAIENLSSAYEYDMLSLSKGQVDEIGSRLTYSNLGYALVRKCKELIEKENNKININEIEENLKKAKRFFKMVQVDKPPIVPDQLLKDKELLSALMRAKEGSELCDEVKKKLQKRFI